ARARVERHLQIRMNAEVGTMKQPPISPSSFRVQTSDFITHRSEFSDHPAAPAFGSPQAVDKSTPDLSGRENCCTRPRSARARPRAAWRSRKTTRLPH